jgi:hypothetical protein
MFQGLLFLKKNPIIKKSNPITLFLHAWKVPQSSENEENLP